MAVFRCRYCGRFFCPDPRKRGRSKQKTCGRQNCRRKNERRRWREWIRRSPGWTAKRQKKVRDWGTAYPHYWQRYRANSPAYREREKLRMRRKRAGVRRVAKQTLRRDILVEKLLTVKRMGSRSVAKQTVITRRVDALVDALIWKEAVAKQSLIASGPPVAG
jgi:hypothetical protein